MGIDVEVSTMEIELPAPVTKIIAEELGLEQFAKFNESAQVIIVKTLQRALEELDMADENKVAQQ